MSLDHREFAAAKEPLNRARSMPAGFYTDPAIFAAEREKLFLKHWFFLTRSEELPEPGDYVTYDNAGRSYLIVRQDDGSLRFAPWRAFPRPGRRNWR